MLATAKQQSGQSLDEFMQVLRSLSKDCNFRQVSADQYRQEMIRDVFNNGLSSSVIRQRLLENRELFLDDGITKANVLDLAQQNAQVYDQPKESPVFAVARDALQHNQAVIQPRYQQNRRFSTSASKDLPSKSLFLLREQHPSRTKELTGTDSNLLFMQ